MTDAPRDMRLRLVVLGTIILSLFSALVLRLYYLQVLASGDYEEAAQANRVRLVPIEGARGRILDRNGEVLVKNRPSLVVAIRPDVMVDRKGTIDRLSQLLGKTPEQIEERLADKRVLPYTAIAVAEDVSESTVVFISEHSDEFVGVVHEIRPVRVYPHGTVAAHFLGYTGEITQDQLAGERYPRQAGYRQGSIIGRSGVEYAYEGDLRGREGLVKLEVDSAGRARQILGKQDDCGGRCPVPGYDVVTTIDLRIQKLVEVSLAQGIEKARTILDRESQTKYLAPAGGAVVLDPRNGEVLATASYPSYDPSLFVGGISKSDFEVLRNDPAKPLIDRVTQAAFPPGSTFKAITAAAALQEGIASRTGRFACPASFRFSDTTFRNWRSVDSGMISLPQALIDSCDTVFYGFGAEFWRSFRRGEGEHLQEWSRNFGYGQKSGIELPFESAGRVPDEDWLKETHARFPQAFPYSVWLPGYTINMSIGQGDLLSTPLQLANSYAVVANGGTLYKPRVGLRVLDGEDVLRPIGHEEIRKLPITPANLDTIRRGLEGVALTGTARAAFSGFPAGRVSVAAKTGTAELQTIPPKQPYAWFVAYAPARNPQYVVAVMLEEGGHGGETAAPIARRILEGVFELPLSEISPGARTD